MIAYHCEPNTILQSPSVNRKDKHIIRAYSSIMQKLADRGHHVDIQILDNEVMIDRKVHNNQIENLNNNQTQTRLPQMKKHKKFTYGTNL